MSPFRNITATRSAGGGGGSATPPAPAPVTPPAEVAGWPLGVDLYALNSYLGAPISAAGFANLRAQGKVFAILKSSQGTADDGQFTAYYQRAADAGLIRGSYHFYTNPKAPVAPGSGTVAQQADKVISLIPRLGPGDLAPALDLEDEPRGAAKRYPLDEGVAPGQTGYHYRTTQAGRTEVIADTQDFLDRIETALGRTPLIYTSVMWMDSDMMNNPTDLAAYPLWTVNHGRTARLVDIDVGGWGTAWDIIQYAEDGKTVFGIANYSEPGIGIGGCDFDAYRGALAGLRGLADLGRPAAAMTSAVSFAAHAEADGALHVRTGPGWTDRNLGARDLPGVSADPDMIANASGVYLYYRREGRLMEARSEAGAPWQAEAIDDGTAPFNNPRAVADGTMRHVAYWGDDDDWHVLSWDGAWAERGGVLTLAGVKTAAGGGASGQPIPYVVDGVLHLVGRAGQDGHLYDLWQENGAWRQDDLTALGRDLAADMPVATYAPAVGTISGAALIVFRGLRGDLWAISRADNAPTNLTQTTGAQSALGHPTCVTRNGDEPHIIYRAADKLIHEIWLESGQWHVQQVCTEPAAADPVAATDGAAIIVAIRAADNTLHMARFDGGVWTCDAAPTLDDGTSPDGGGASS